jgi:hypothetical protein
MCERRKALSVFRVICPALKVNVFAKRDRVTLIRVITGDQVRVYVAAFMDPNRVEWGFEIEPELGKNIRLNGVGRTVKSFFCWKFDFGMRSFLPPRYAA